LISFVARMMFGTDMTSNTSIAAYEPTPEINAIIIFNQMDAIAHEKDNFFHQTGKIYTLSGDTLFQKYDTMFHVLDNAYHRSIDAKEKLRWAQKLVKFIKVQNTLFASTEYINVEQDKTFKELDEDFNQALTQIPQDMIEEITGTVQNITGTKK
jgi:hypothetical protein